MKESIKKNRMIFLLFFIVINFGCSNIVAQNKTQKDFYNYLDKWIGDKEKFKFIQINLVIDCKNELLFTVSKKDLIYDNQKKFKVYKYKDMLILYELDENVIIKKNIDFFDKYLQNIDYNVQMLPIGNQSLINGYVLYFKNSKLITDDRKIHFFMENNCKSLN